MKFSKVTLVYTLAVACALIATVASQADVSVTTQPTKALGNDTTPETTTKTTTSTSVAPDTTTSQTTTPSTTTSSTTTSSTTPATTTSSTSSTTSSTTTTTSTTTPASTSSTSAPTTPAPDHGHDNFSTLSFIGGMVLAFGLVAIGYVAFKFYKARNERNYHTL